MQPIIRSIMGDRDIFDRWKKKLRFRAYRDKKYKKKLILGLEEILEGLIWKKKIMYSRYSLI